MPNRVSVVVPMCCHLNRIQKTKLTARVSRLDSVRSEDSLSVEDIHGLGVPGLNQKDKWSWAPAVSVFPCFMAEDTLRPAGACHKDFPATMLSSDDGPSLLKLLGQVFCSNIGKHS